MSIAINRRSLLLNALPFTASTAYLMGQQPGADLTLSNASGITVKPIGDLARPVLAVMLPGQTIGHAAAVELPEHAWGRRRGQNDQEWFYKLFSSDSQYRPTTSWEKQQTSLKYRMSLTSGVRLYGEARLEDDGLAISYELENTTDVDYELAQAVTCVKLYRPFNDVFLERTYVHHPSGLSLVASETPERLTMNAEEWLPCRYIVRCSPPAISPGMRIEKTSDRIVRYTKLELADIPFMATESAPAGWVAATHTLECPSIFTNPARTCQHTDPFTQLPPKGRGKLSLKFYLIRGSLNDAWMRISINHKSNRI